MPYVLHPAGNFESTIVDHGFSLSKGGSTQFWTIFNTSEDQITGYWSMSEKAVEYTIKKIRNMGYAGNDLRELEDGSALRGHTCVITVKHEDYEGKTRAKIDGVWPTGSTGGPTRDEKAAENAARFNRLLKNIPPIHTDAATQAKVEQEARSRLTAQAKASQPKDQGFDDDIPW